MDCKKLAKTVITKEDISVKNKEIYDILIKELKDQNFKQLKPKNIKILFETVDNVYFDGKIQTNLNKLDVDLVFKTSKRLTKTAGKCKKRGNKYEIVLSTPILDSLFNRGEKSHKINGLHCYDRIECLINLFQHELVHFILFVFCPKLGEGHGGHTSTFMGIVNGLFGHTDYKHMLLFGDSKEIDKKVGDIKANVEIGDFVISKEMDGKIFKGHVRKINPKSLTIIMDNGKIMRLYYTIIDKFEKGNNIGKNMSKPKNTMNINKLKKSLNIGKNVKVKIKGKISNGKITKINPKRARIKMEDGKEYNVPYVLIL